MYKYFYNIDKKIYTFNLSQAGYILNDYSGLTINHTIQYVRELIRHEHRNIITLLSEQTNILYHININAVSSIGLNDNSELQITFTDNSELLFDYSLTGQNEYIRRYAKAIYNANNLELYKAGKTIYRVHPDFTNADYEFDNIQDCIDAMNAGDYMLVYPGTYPESLNIDKSIDIEFSDGVIINSSNAVNLIFSSNVYINIFGNAELISETHNITNANGADVFIEFDTATSETNYNFSGAYGNLIMKGNSIVSETERNMFEFSENKNMFDVLNFVAYLENLHNNQVEIASNHFFGFLNTRFESRGYNFNIEHAQSSNDSETIHYYNALFYVSNNTDGSVSTYTGGTDDPVNIYLHNCYFDTPVNTLYDIYSFYGDGGTRGEINLNLLSNIYGKRGMTDSTQGLYLTANTGNNFIVDSEINIGNIT